MKRYKNFGILRAITLIPSKSLYQNQQYVVPRISVLIERLRCLEKFMADFHQYLVLLLLLLLLLLLFIRWSLRKVE